MGRGYHGCMLPLDPSAEDMRAMGRTAVEYLIGFIEGLDNAPAANAEAGLELARRRCQGTKDSSDMAAHS